jgi:hypothetical protein
MATSENDPAPTTLYFGSDANSLDSAPLPGQGIEPELKVISGESISAKRSDGRPKYIEEIFAKQNWHKPYAEALMEEDSSKIPVAIATAERAIFNRYLELLASKHHSDEGVDLWRAVEALRELEDAAKTASTAKNQRHQ